jgi:hypothetical protein
MQKLVLAGQIKFERGRVELLNQKINIFPTSVFSTIVENNPSVIKDLYNSTKQSAKLFSQEVQKKYGFDGRELKKWLIDITALAGWGEAEFVKYDDKKFHAIVRMRNSSVASISKKKMCVDHAVRGFFAGGGSISMNKDLDSIEIKCVAKGDKVCEFVVAEKNFLKKKYPDIFNEQLGWNDG